MSARLVVRADKMAAGGDAIARLPGGKVVFIDGALPGETVAIELLEDRKDFARATVAEVREGSADRVVPPCPAVARGCGGCRWQHIEPRAQLRWKVAIAADALARIGKLTDPVVVAGKAVPPFAYRTTLRLAPGAAGRLGLRARATHDIVVLDDCLVAHPRLAGLLPGLRCSGEDAVLRIGVAGGERAAMGDGLSGLPEDVTIGPKAAVHEDVGGVRLRVSMASFFQSGPAAATLLVEAVRQACAAYIDEPGVVDLYAGVGLFSAALRLPAPVVVESSRSACANARVNLGAGARVECTPVERWRPTAAPLVIADPARSGLGRPGVDKVAATGAERAVLVSCDAAALGRDAALFIAAGFAYGGTTVLDLFPNTSHLEAVTIFSR